MGQIEEWIGVDDLLLRNQHIVLVVYVQYCTQYCAGGKIEKNEMGGACSAYGGGERCAQGSGWGT